MPFTWTDDNTATLRAKHADGIPMREIAAELGCTRNACIGKAHRLGLVSSWAPTLSQTPSAKRHRERASSHGQPTPPPSQRPVTLARSTFNVFAMRAKTLDRTATFRTVKRGKSDGNPYPGYSAYDAPDLPGEQGADADATLAGELVTGGIGGRLSKVAAAPAASNPVDIFGLTSRTCRNPLGPKMERAVMYCGAPTKAGSPYCPACHAVNYAPRLPPTRATVDKQQSRFGYLQAAE